MRRVLFTGGTGYLGRELVRQASRQGVAVGASFHCTPPPDGSSDGPAVSDSPAPVYWFPLDVRDKQAVAAALSEVRPEVIFHTAYRQNEPDLQAVTTDGARWVAEAAHAIGARLIHLSSDVIFSGNRDTPYTEADLPDPVTAYGAAKAEAERLVSAACPGAVLVRTSLIYGFDPLDRHTRFALEIAEGKRHEQLFHDEYRCPIVVYDLAAALLELATLPFQGIINIAGSDRVSRYEFGRLLARFHGYDPNRIASASIHTCATPRPRDCALDVRLAQRMLNTPLRGVKTVLVRKPSF
jgi:dTDP-4-dehydrorhamnose reductase